MIVIKKTGKQEEFSLGKLSRSIRAANTGTDETGNMALLLDEFQEIVKGKKFVTVRQIDIIVYGLLYSEGLLKTLVKYITYDKSQ